MGPRLLKAVRLLPEAWSALGDAAPDADAGRRQRLTDGQRRVLEHLAQQDGELVGQKDLCAALGVSEAVVGGLVRRGLLQAEQAAVRRAPRGYDAARDTAPDLTPFQGAAADGIVAAMRRGEGETLLLFGVTGSGKTEVYLPPSPAAAPAARPRSCWCRKSP